MFDIVKVTDSLDLSLKGGQEVRRSYSDRGIEIKGSFIIEAFERGKKIRSKCREEHNIWLLEGRAYDAMVKSYASYAPDTPVRNDRIRYVGVGSGTQPEVSTISRLVTPVAWDVGGHFLAPLDIPTFSPDFTIVTYTRTFQTTDISIAGTITISEIGLFTDGVAPSYTPGSRDTTLVNATSQRPLCYRTFEPLPKTTDTTLVIRYSLFHN